MKLPFVADPAIKPKYRTHPKKNVIDLDKGIFEIVQGGNTLRLQGALQLELSLIPAIKFYVTDRNPGKNGTLQIGEALLSFSNLHQAVRIRILRVSENRGIKGSQNDYAGRVVEQMLVGRKRRCSAAILHLANFQDVAGAPITQVVGRRQPIWHGRLELKDEDWKISIDALHDISDRFKLLKSSGGYSITHAIRIERADGKAFYESKLAPCLEDLRLFLSFAQGMWTEPFLCVGLNQNGTELWQTWSAPRTNRWRGVDSWFDGSRSVDLADFWPSFRRRLSDPLWGDILKRALPWYLAANKRDGGEQGSIVLAQTAQELLSWTAMVNTNRLSEKGFDSLKAHDKLRLLLAEAGIDREIPPVLKALRYSSQLGRRKDGPEVITEIRNAIVHPSPSNLKALGKFNDQAIEEAYRLTMWYLELIVLFLTDYRGQYSNRLLTRWWGQTELVPWEI